MNVAAWLDRAIATISPSAGAARARARQQIAAREAAVALYEGATLGRRGASFRRKATDANAETRGQLGRLRDGSRDFVRNNAWAKRGKEAIAHNVVGAGILPHADGGSEQARQTAERLMVEHFDTVAVDADGRHDLYGLQNLIMGAVVESGEVLVRRRRRRAEDDLPLPFQLQVLEPDHLDQNRDGPQPNGQRDIQGIRYDAVGRRVGYWLFPEHPGALSAGMVHGMTSRLVPAEDVAHVYRMDRPGQVRGVPWLAPVMLRLRDFADYEDAQLMRQKIAACFAAFERDIERGDDEPATAAATGGNAEARQEHLEPGLIQKLGPGRTIEFANPPRVDGYSDYSANQLRAIATGLGITYEALTSDLSKVNFASGRMGWIEMQRNIDIWRWHLLAPCLLQRIDRWFGEAARVSGRLREPVPLRWTAPRREMIDPTREVPANRDAVRSGQKTPSDLVRESGRDPEEHWTEYERDMARLDRGNLVLDIDARRVSRAGTTHGQVTPDMLGASDGPAEAE
jgi:lambda family phage portal protein